jgi:hypothetical protein
VKPLYAYKCNRRGWQAVATSIRDILIGYDLMPLRGLPETKRRLLEKGALHRIEFVPSPTGKYFALFHKGRIVRESLGYAGFPDQVKWQAIRHALMYLSDVLDKNLQGDELKEYCLLCWSIRPDWRKSKWRKRVMAMLPVLERLGYGLKRVELCVVEKAVSA